MFQACVVVNVKTGGMFLRITQNGESVPALVALWCADKRLFARARWTRIVVFLQSCDRSQHRHDISCIGSSEKIVRSVLRAYVVHSLNLVAERWVPGSVNS